MTTADRAGLGDDVEREFAGLYHRFMELSDRVLHGVKDPSSAEALSDVLQEFSAAVEELEVSTEEIHAQNEALEVAQVRIDQEV